MLPETIVLADGTQYRKTVTEANNVKEGSLTASNLLPGVEGSLGLVRCVKALHLPQQKMEIAWVSEDGHKVFEGIYNEESLISIYE